MDEARIDELLKLIGETFYSWEHNQNIRAEGELIYAWMQANAPQYLKN